MGEMKPTPGPVYHHGPAGSQHTAGGFISSTPDRHGSPVICSIYGLDGQPHEANARLIVEAFNAHHNTGLSPVQLVEMVKELKAALGGITEMCEQHGDFRNGVTDPAGTIDEGNVVAGRFIGSARAALAKCEGVGNE